MTKQEIIAELQAQNPILTYGINDKVFEMSPEEYQATINSWADARIAKEEAKAEAEIQRQLKISAYGKLGLTLEEIEALVPTSESIELKP